MLPILSRIRCTAFSAPTICSLDSQDQPSVACTARPDNIGDHPDLVWHVDIMYLYIRPRWYYLVDILDGYSRYLVAWHLNLTMLADTVTSTAQQALDKLTSRPPGEPRIVHDHGSQFVGAEWHRFVAASGVTDIKTRVAHPESNGRLERLHRTHPEEGLTDDDQSSYYAACDGMTRWSAYYNTERPHSSLGYLSTRRITTGEARRLVWPSDGRSWLRHSHSGKPIGRPFQVLKGRTTPHIIKGPFCLISIRAIHNYAASSGRSLLDFTPCQAKYRTNR